MKKNNNKTNVLNTNTGVQHVQIAGVAYYDESKYFMFAPDFIARTECQVCECEVWRNRCQTAPSTCGTAKEKASFAAD